MVRAQRAKLTRKPKKTPLYDEDDPEAYKDMPTPDKRSSYTKDKIDEYHDEKIASHLARGVQLSSDEEVLDDEEEVMALDDSESEEDDEVVDKEDGTDMESDLEEKKEEDLPNELAWGKKKKMFYDSDYVTTKKKKPEELEEEEREEEEEAIKIQKRFTANLSEEDYDLNFFQEIAGEEKDEDGATKIEKIVKDLKEISQKEKVKLLKTESPELLELIQDFKKKLTQLKDEIQPLVQMVTDGRIPPGKGADYLKTKQQLYLNYCINISFYLVLKAKRIPANNHPVIERLLTYKNLINKLTEVDVRLAPELRKLLAGKETLSNRTTEDKKTIKNYEEFVSEDMDSDSELDEEAALQFYKGVEQRMKLKRKGIDTETAELEECDEEEGAKRGITYQMVKNKGLTPSRKKIDRNPRVKHREKFRRAKIRRKGQVREVRKEERRYSGEMSGIRVGVKKSIKLKT